MGESWGLEKVNIPKPLNRQNTDNTMAKLYRTNEQRNTILKIERKTNTATY